MCRRPAHEEDSPLSTMKMTGMFASSTTLSKLEQHLQQGEASRVACCEALALGAAVAMADIVRQVEVHCLERGRALALVWNLYTASVTTGTGAGPLPAASSVPQWLK